MLECVHVAAPVCCDTCMFWFGDTTVAAQRTHVVMDAKIHASVHVCVCVGDVCAREAGWDGPEGEYACSLCREAGKESDSSRGWFGEEAASGAS